MHTGGRLHYNAIRQQDDLAQDCRHVWKKLWRNVGETIDERFDMTDRAEIVRKKVSRLLTERFGDIDKIFDVQPALVGLETREVRR